jgi:hypothetical protein
MDLVLLSARSPAPGVDHSAEAVAGLAAGLARTGCHRLRWLRPVVGGEAPLSIDGVQTIRIATRRVPFRSVVSRLVDLPTERALSAALREAPPDLLQIHGFGAASSCLGPWIADRLGVPSLVVVDDLAELLCHRRTLIDAAGQGCSVFDEPERCARCCRAASPDGLGAFAALAAALLRPVAGLSPFPARVDFENRLDMLVSGLLAARQVRVRGAAEAAALVAVGVPPRLVVPGLPADVAGWEQVWRGLLAA